MSPTAVSKSGKLLVLALISLIAGAAAGLLAAVFRLALQRADRLRDSALGWGHNQRIVGFLPRDLSHEGSQVAAVPAERMRSEAPPSQVGKIPLH